MMTRQKMLFSGEFILKILLEDITVQNSLEKFPLTHIEVVKFVIASNCRILRITVF